MKSLLDTHTHTIASGHAYSTVNEMVLGAKEKGIELICITDHAPEMPGSCSDMHFRNFKVIDRILHGVNVMMGAELNIMSYDGDVDLSPNVLKKLDMCIASFHNICLTPGSREENTRAYLKVIENDFVNIIGHPDDGRVPADYDELAKHAKETNTIIEINNSSLKPTSSRVNSRENSIMILKACEKYGTYVTIGSDAHFYTEVGNHSIALDLIKEVHFPNELVVNFSIDLFKEVLGKKGN